MLFIAAGRWHGVGRGEGEGDGETFYVINERICNAYNPYDDVSYEDACKVIELDYTLVLRDGPDIQERVEAANNFSVKPKEIYVVCEGNGYELYKKLKSSVPLFVKEYLEHYDVAVKDVMARSKTMFALNGADNEFIEYLEKLYNEELVHFIAVVGKYECIQVRAYTYLGEDVYTHELCMRV